MDVETLGIAVDSRDVKTASADLNRLGDSAARTEGQIGTMSRQMDGAEKSSSALSSSVKLLGGAFAALGIGAVTQELIKQADAWGQLQAKVGLAIKDQSRASEVTNELVASANAVRAPLEAFATLFGRLAPSVLQYGGSVADARLVTENFSKTLKISGATAEESASAMLQFSQALAAGRLGGEEFNAVNEANSRFMNLLAQSLGVTRGELKQLASDGKLTSDVLLNALGNSTQQLDKEFEQLPLTVGDATTAIGNSFLKLVGTFNQTTGITGELSAALQHASGTLDTITASLEGTNGKAKETGALAGAIGKVFDTIAVLGANVAYVFKAIGTEIGVLAAQAAAFAKLDFKQGLAIGEAAREDAEKARAAIDKLSADIINGNKEVAKSTADVSSGFTVASAANTEFLTKAQKKTAELLKLQQDFNKATLNIQDSAKLAEMTIALREKQAAIEKKYTEHVKVNTEAKKAQNEVERRSLALYETEDKILEEIEKAREKRIKGMIDGYEKQAEEAEKAATAAETELANYGKTDAQIADLTVTKLEALRVDILIAKHAEEVTDPVLNKQLETVERQIDAYKRLSNAKTQTDALKANAETAKKVADEWAKTSDKISDTITDALMRGFEGGKGIVRNFIDTLVNTFKSLVLQPTIKATVSSVLGLGGTQAQAGGLGNLLSSGSSLYDLGKTFLEGGELFSGAASALTAFGAANTGFLGNLALGAGGGLAGGLAGAGSAASAGLGLLGQGEIGLGLGNLAGALGAVAPYAAAIYAAYKILVKDRGGPKTGGSAIAGTAETIFKERDLQAGNAEVKAVVDQLQSNIDTAVKALGGVNTLVAGLGYTMDPQGTAQNQIASVLRDAQGNAVFQTGRENAGRTAEDVQKNLALEAQRVLVAAIQNSNVAAEYKKAISDALGGTAIKDATEQQLAAVNALITGIQALKATFDQFGKVLPQLANLSYDTQKALADAAGGVDKLGSALSSYYQNFYSEEERTKSATDQLTAQFKALGFTLPQSRDQLRALIEAQDLNTESGRKTYLALLNLSGAFADLVPAAKDATAALAGLASGALSRLQVSIDAEKTAAKASYDAKVKALNDQKDKENAAYAATKAALEEQQRIQDAYYANAIVSAQSQVQSLTSAQQTLANLSNGLIQAIDKINGSTQGYAAMVREQARAQLDAALATAKLTGQLPKLEDISNALTSFSTIDPNVFSSAADLAFEQARSAGVLGQLNDITSGQKDTATRQLEIAQATLASLQTSQNDSRASSQAALDAAAKQHDENIAKIDEQIAKETEKYDSQISYLDGLLANAKQQLDIANGTYEATLSLGDALSAFNTTLNNLIASQEQSARRQTQALIDSLASRAASPTDTTQAVVAELKQQMADQAKQAEVRDFAIAEASIATARVLKKFDNDGLPTTRSDA